MGKAYRKGPGSARPERRITVRGVRRKQPDLRKLARALIDLAAAQAEADAQAEAAVSSATPPSPASPRANPEPRR